MATRRPAPGRTTWHRQRRAGAGTRPGRNFRHCRPRGASACLCWCSGLAPRSNPRQARSAGYSRIFVAGSLRSGTQGGGEGTGVPQKGPDLARLWGGGGWLWPGLPKRVFLPGYPGGGGSRILPGHNGGPAPLRRARRGAGPWGICPAQYEIPTCLSPGWAETCSAQFCPISWMCDFRAFCPNSVLFYADHVPSFFCVWTGMICR